MPADASCWPPSPSTTSASTSRPPPPPAPAPPCFEAASASMPSSPSLAASRYVPPHMRLLAPDSDCPPSDPPGPTPAPQSGNEHPPTLGATTTATSAPLQSFDPCIHLDSALPPSTPTAPVYIPAPIPAALPARASSRPDPLEAAVPAPVSTDATGLLMCPPRSQEPADPEAEGALRPGDRVGPHELRNSQPIRLVAARPDTPGAGPTVQVVKPLGQGTYTSIHLARQVAGAPLPRPHGSEGDGDQVLLLTSLSKYYLSPALLADELSDAQFHLSLPVHPNLVTRYAVLDTPDHLFVLNELVPGYDLFYLLELSPVRPDEKADGAPDVVPASHGPDNLGRLAWLAVTDGPSLFAPPRVRVLVDLFGQLCDVLQTLHDWGLALGDVTPQNLVAMVGLSPRPPSGPGPAPCTHEDEVPVVLKLMDLHHATSDVSLTRQDGASTPEPYIAPECAEEGQAYNPKKAEVWSLGILLLNLLFHRHPFRLAQSQVCPSYACFESDPVEFLLTAFDGLPQPVACFLANHVLHPEPDQRATPSQISLWARTALLRTLLSLSDADRSRSRGAAMGITLPLTSGPPRARSSSRLPRSRSRPPARDSPSKSNPVTPVRGRSRNAHASSYISDLDEDDEVEDLAAHADHALSMPATEGSAASHADGPTSQGQSQSRRRKRGNRRGTSTHKAQSVGSRRNSSDTFSVACTTGTTMPNATAGYDPDSTAMLLPSSGPRLSASPVPSSSRGASPQPPSPWVGLLPGGPRSRDASVYPGHFPDKAAQVLGAHPQPQLPARPQVGPAGTAVGEPRKSQSSIEADRTSLASLAWSLGGSTTTGPSVRGSVQSGTSSLLVPLQAHMAGPSPSASPAPVAHGTSFGASACADDAASIFSAHSSASAPAGPVPSRRSVESSMSSRTSFSRATDGHGHGLWNRNLRPISEQRPRSAHSHSRVGWRSSDKSRARTELDASYLAEIFGAPHPHHSGSQDMGLRSLPAVSASSHAYPSSARSSTSAPSQRVSSSSSFASLNLSRAPAPPPLAPGGAASAPTPAPAPASKLPHAPGPTNEAHRLSRRTGSSHLPPLHPQARTQQRTQTHAQASSEQGNRALAKLFRAGRRDGFL